MTLFDREEHRETARACRILANQIEQLQPDGELAYAALADIADELRQAGRRILALTEG